MTIKNKQVRKANHMNCDTRQEAANQSEADHLIKKIDRQGELGCIKYWSLSHYDKDFINQGFSESYINNIHIFRHLLLLKPIDIDAVRNYNSINGINGEQSTDFIKKTARRKEVKQPKRFKGQWFQELFVSIRDKKVGHSNPLSEADLMKHIGSQELPDGHTSLEVVDALNYELRKYRAEIMPIIKTQKDLEKLTLRHYEMPLKKLLSEQSYNQSISAIRRIYFKFLNEATDEDIQIKIKNVMDALDIPIMLFHPKNIDRFFKWTKTQTIGFHASDISKVRGVAKIIFERTSSPIRTRAKKHSVLCPEIEDLLQKFKGTSYAGKQAKNIICHVRQALNLAEIFTIKDFKRSATLDCIIELYHQGRISDAHITRIKPFFFWFAASELKIKVPIFFENKKISAIHELSEVQKQWFSLNIENLLLQNKYKRNSTKRPLDLYRLLLAQLESRNESSIVEIKPSDFICGVSLAVKKDRNLGLLRGIKPFADSVLDYATQKNKWTFFDETFEEFQNACETAIENCGNQILESLDLLKYRIAFIEGNKNWRLFFETLTADYYNLSRDHELQKKGTRAAQKDVVSGKIYEEVHTNLFEVAYGKECAKDSLNSKLSVDGKYREGGLLDKDFRNFSIEDAKRLERYTAYALQAIGGLRFRSESKDLIFLEKEPVFSKNCPSCIFPKKYMDEFFGETTALALYLPAESRKNSIAYFVPLNDLADAFLLKHLAVQNIKNGQKIFTLGTSTLADEIKRISCKWFDANVSFDDLKSGKKSNTALTTHRYRNIVVQAVELYYKGHDSGLIQAVMLGQKLDRDTGSSTTEVYASYLGTCEKLFATIRRLKNQNYKTDEEFRSEKLQEEILSLREESRQNHFENMDGHKSTFEAIYGMREILAEVLKMDSQALEQLKKNPAEQEIFISQKKFLSVKGE